MAMLDWSAFLKKILFVSGANVNIKDSCHYRVQYNSTTATPPNSAI